ncbi:MAG: bifunctional diaminohydroxyphosphoribosylaminopyrimidine deaminase/5-amino-6-(5-phosphoribosylamino)uracil reductase RibD [Sedimentisphaerales bacterium]|nr:bifunctional diaminohydroxyphosphoribosylaminopyrimidine deaminase/5-amino-6-(5-phosphoribosylamino)uracil reductase RibD [Sedimentisphaerales bacterium]
MKMALRLAQFGVGLVEPNPAVGCVIVRDGKVIGKGYHKKFGEAHAEVNALHDCRVRGNNPEGATMYVTLEPCCHQGKTGPCTEAILAAKIGRLFVAMSDPSEHNDGRGIRQLRAAGLDVEVGLCEHYSRLLNAAFVKYARTHRPYVIVKWAQSLDGKLAWKPETGNRWISNAQSRKDAHKMRRASQAILTGVNTILADDPALTPRPPKGKVPLRVVADSKLRIPLGRRFMNTRRFPSMIFSTEEGVVGQDKKIDKILAKGVDLTVVPTINERCGLRTVLTELARREIHQVLVEAGPTLISSLLEEGLVDAVRIYIAPMILGGQGHVPISDAMAAVTQCKTLKDMEIKTFGQDVCICGEIHALDSFSV